MASSPRFLALDVFRGITICFMIIVNTPGDSNTFAPLLHAQWHGFTPTDLVFPSFLFAVGNAISFTMVKWQKLSQSQVLWRIFKRTLLIFLIGFLMYWFPFVQDSDNGWQLRPIASTRIFGVLQRIALCYGIAALMLYFLKPKWNLALGLLILVAYKFILTSYGDLSLEGNAVLALDKMLIGERHLYMGEGVPFDPEGLLSTLPAIVNVIFGYFAGVYIQRKSISGDKGSIYEMISHLMLAGVLLLTLAYFWNFSFPVNKKLWTSSFVLCTVGLDLIILSVVIYIIDILKKTRWTYFFEVFGKNPLFIYLVSEIGVILFWTFSVGDKSFYGWLYQSFFSFAGPYFGSLLFALWWMFMCWLVGWWMDKKKIYIRV